MTVTSAPRITTPAKENEIRPVMFMSQDGEESPCFIDTVVTKGPGIFWQLCDGMWEARARKNWFGVEYPVLVKPSSETPTELDLDLARKVYFSWMNWCQTTQTPIEVDPIFYGMGFPFDREDVVPIAGVAKDVVVSYDSCIIHAILHQSDVNIISASKKISINNYPQDVCDIKLIGSYMGMAYIQLHTV